MTAAYKDAGLAAKDSLGKKTVWTVQNEHMAQACIERDWAGSHFSKRIWKNRYRLARTVEQEITDCIINGKEKNELLKVLNERWGVSRSQADCLVRTEMAHTLNTAQIETYADEGVHYLELDAEPSACEKCAEVADKIYRIDAIPFVIGHPRCRCTWIAVKDDDSRVAKRVNNAKFTGGKIKAQNNTEDMDYMKTPFKDGSRTPVYGKEKIVIIPKIGGGNFTIELMPIVNSQFNLYADEGCSEMAIRLNEQNLSKVSKIKGAEIKDTKFAIVDFDKHGLNKDAIAGYEKSEDVIYINSKFNSMEKIKAFISETSNYFANKTEFAPYLHELGHKKFENLIKSIATDKNMSYNKVIEKLKQRVMEYLKPYREHNINFVSDNLSEYTNDGIFNNNKIQEVYAECFSIENDNNELKEQLLEILYNL